MKKARKLIVMALACIMLLGSTLSAQAYTCPNGNHSIRSTGCPYCHAANAGVCYICGFFANCSSCGRHG